VVSILGIGCLTALIGDMASHLGCTVGLKDAVTAIAFVALGTSVPGKEAPCYIIIRLRRSCLYSECKHCSLVKCAYNLYIYGCEVYCGI